MKGLNIHTIAYSYFAKNLFKPSSPIWSIRNDGYFDFKIGSSFILKSRQTFSIDMEKFIKKFIAKGYEVINETQFELSVQAPPFPTGDPLDPTVQNAIRVWRHFYYESFISVTETKVNIV